MRHTSVVALILVAALIPGCVGGGGAVLLPEIDLSAAQKLEKKGKLLESCIEYAGIVAKLTEDKREDGKARLAWARIQQALYRMKVWDLAKNLGPDVRRKLDPLNPWLGESGAALLAAGSANHWGFVLESGEQDPVMVEGARAIAGFLWDKLEHPELRRGKIDAKGALADRLYTVHLVTGLAEMECFALSRTPEKERDATKAIKALQEAAAEWNTLAQAGAVQPQVDLAWRAKGAAYTARAKNLQSGGDAGQIPPETREFALLGPDGADGRGGHLKLASDEIDRANEEIAHRGALPVIVEAFEKAFSHLIYARESIVEPTSLQKFKLDLLPSSVATYLRQVAGN